MLENHVRDAATLHPEKAREEDPFGALQQAAGRGSPAEDDPAADPSLPRALYLKTRLEDAERLLAYAADCGRVIDNAVSMQVFAARSAEDAGRWTPSIAQGLLSALTVLSKALNPVSGESLRLCSNEEEAQQTTRSYKRVAFWIAAVIVPFSLATFITSGIAKSLREDVKRANELAVILTNEVRPAPAAPDPNAANLNAEDAAAKALKETKALEDRNAVVALPSGTSQKEVIAHLAEFAALIRAINSGGKQLHFFVPWADVKSEPEARLELQPTLRNFYASAADRVAVYQKVRFFAQTVDNAVAIIYGAFATCVLPVFYAVLGACAYLLRQFELQMRTHTLQDADGHLARFLIAAIAGAVIGLFSNFKLDEGASVSPLALAFLVGYAADVFFTFLEALTQSFNRSRNPPSGQGATTVGR